MNDKHTIATLVSSPSCDVMNPTRWTLSVTYDNQRAARVYIYKIGGGGYYLTRKQ